MIGVDLAERLIEAGELTRADALLTSAERDSTSAEHGPAALNRLEWLVLAKPEQAAAAVESRLPTMLEDFTRTRDDRRLAKAHLLAFWVHWASNHAIPAAEQARLAAEHAGNAGDNGLRSRALGWYVVTIIYGPQSVEIIARELDAIERDRPGPYLASCVDLGRGEVERLHGRFTEAHRLTQRAVNGFIALGMQPMAAGCVQQLAQVELSEGEPVAARESLLQCDEILAELGERPQRATTQALLARVHELLGATAQAREALGLAEQLSAPEDAINFAITHGVRARLALADDDLASAERWAKRAVEQAFRTDFIGLRAEARLGLARVLRAIGQPAQAHSEAHEALNLFAAKGDRPGSDAAQSLLDLL
jgi:tetratricopeptide (TPR) repeat protein